MKKLNKRTVPSVVVIVNLLLASASIYIVPTRRNGFSESISELSSVSDAVPNTSKSGGIVHLAGYSDRDKAGPTLLPGSRGGVR